MPNYIVKNKKTLSVWVRILTGIFLLQIISITNAAAQTGWDNVPEILAEIVAPDFPDKDFFVTDFGAKGDGIKDCTQAFKDAIAACNTAGGGRVVVPEGKFLTGAIHLKDNVNLHITKNAVVLFASDPEKYLPVVYTRFEGVECMNYSPLIYAYDAENIAITGQGILDGQADNETWWPWKGKKEYGWDEGEPNQKKSRDILFSMGDNGVPVEKRLFGQNHYLRPSFIQPYKSRSILIDSVTIKRSPMWEIHPVLCENVTVQNVKVISLGPNNDGCNPESSKNVLIKNSYFDTGDDCIAIKSGRNNDGRRVNVASENIIVQGCRMKDGHGGVVIGSEVSGGCRNVFIEDCIMSSPNLDIALRIKTNSMRGGIVENIYMRDVEVGQVSDAIVKVNFNYGEGDRGEHTPIVRNIFLNEVSSNKSKYALSLNGYDRSPVINLNIENCNFKGVAKGNILKHYKNLTMKAVYINEKLYE